MTPDFDDHLQALFADAAQALPPAVFAADVTSRIRAHRRRVRWLQVTAVAITILSVWSLAPDLAGGVAVLNRLPDTMAALAARSLRALSDSPGLPLLYLYGGTLLVALLLRLVHRSRIRWA